MDDNRSHLMGVFQLNQTSNTSSLNSIIFHEAIWNFWSAFNLVISLLAVFFNFIVMYFFYKVSSVRTPFNVFLVNLCFANFLFTSVLYTFNTINDLFPYRYPPLSFCIAVRYFNHMGGSSVNNSHLLIALNRLWAVAWPVSYRHFQQQNSILRSAGVCIAMWVYLNAFLLPGILIDGATPHNQPEVYHCNPIPEGPLVFNYLTNIVIFDLPIMVVCIVYPVILYKKLVLVRTRRAVRIEQSTCHPRTLNRNLSAPSTDQSNGQTPKALAATDKKFGNFLTLSCLIAVVVFSLVPTQVYYILTFMGIDTSKVYGTVWVLYSLSPVCDPLLCLLTVKSLRDALKTRLRLG